MKEEDKIERFNRELDSRLQGRKPQQDDGMDKMAALLAGADFSADSRIKDSLRARLLAKRDGKAGFWRELLEMVFSPHPALAAAAACAMILVVSGVLNRQGWQWQAVPEPQPVPATEESVLPSAETGRAIPVSVVESVPERAPEGKPVPVPRKERKDEGGGLFAALPAQGLLKVRSIKAEDLKSGMKTADLIEKVQGRRRSHADGETTTWELEGGTVVLERKVITEDILFERRKF